MLLQNSFAAVFAILSRNLILKYKTANFQILAIIFFYLYLFSLCYVLVAHGSVELSSFAMYAWRFMGGGILFAIWAYLSYRVFGYTDAAIASMLSLLNIIFVIAVATLSIHEGLSLRQCVGAVILLLSLGIIFSARVKRKVQNQWFVAGLLTLCASTAYGFAIANEKWLLGNVSLSSYIVFGFGFQFIPLLVMSTFNISGYQYIKQFDFVWKTSLAGIIRGSAGLLFIISLVKANNASLISVLSGFKVVIATALSVIFLKERTLLSRKLVASLAAVLGVAIMIWK